jgi:hypothetical protein
MPRPTAEIRKPNDGDHFENQCCKLFALHYKHPEMKRTPPKTQFGIDILGYLDGDLDRPVGIQCKAKTNLSEREIREDFQKVLKLDIRVTQWVVATISRGAFQVLARELTEESSTDPKNRIEVIIHDWRQMEILISEYPSCLKVFDPLFSPFLNEMTDGIFKRFDRLEAILSRQLSHKQPLPFALNEALYSSPVDIGLSGQREAIPVIFDHTAFFYAHLFPMAPTNFIGATAIADRLGDAYYELPPSGEEAWRPVGIGDFTLIARNRPRSRPLVRGLEDGVGFFRNGETFVFQGIKNTIEIEGLVTAICNAARYQRELWETQSILVAGVRVRKGDILQFTMGNTEIATIYPDQDLVSGVYETQDCVPLSLFADLLESGHLHTEESPQVLARMLKKGIENREEAEQRLRLQANTWNFDDINI